MKNKESAEVAFIIVGWNNIDLIDECISSIHKQNYSNTSIIYVDNASSDGSSQHVQEKYPDVTVIESETNLGFASGNNLGINKALENIDVSYIALLNTDATLAVDWTDKIVEFAKTKPKGAAFQTITLDYYNHNVIDSSHIFLSHNGQATQGSWRRPLPESSDIAPTQVFGCNAAAVIYSRAFIEAQPYEDLFDSKLFMYLEDVDVAARATVMGWGNYVVPGSRAFHMGSASSGKNPGFSLYLTYRNNIAVLAKNIPLRMVLRMLPSMMRSDRHTLRHLKKTGQSAVRSKVIKGRLIGLVRLPLFTTDIIKMSKYRKRIQKSYLWNLMRAGF